MKKNMVFLTALIMLAGLAWAGGGGQNANTGTAIDRSNFNPLGTYPIVKNKETITVLRATSSLEADMDQNWQTQWYEEKTNIHVNWQYAPPEQFKERVNLVLASGEKVDFINAPYWAPTDFSATEISKLATQGLIYPIGDLIDTDTIHMKENLASVPGFKETLTMTDGRIYLIPDLAECFHCGYYGKMNVNRLFLQNLGLKIPTTPEEFKQMLIAFRDKDANGNGDPHDEIPFVGASKSISEYSAKVDTFLMSAFEYDDGENRLYLKNGKVIASFMQPGFQQGLIYLNDLYKEGLIYPDSFSLDVDTRSKLNSQKYESIIGAIPYAHCLGNGNREVGQPVRWVEYDLIPPLKGPAGIQITRYDAYLKFNASLTVGNMIPATVKNPALVLRWLDYYQSKEGALITNFGEKGVMWDDPDPGAKGASGGPAKFKVIQYAGFSNDSPAAKWKGGLSWDQIIPSFRPASFWGDWQSNGDPLDPSGIGLNDFLYQKTADNYQPYGIKQENVLPPLWYSAEDANEIALLRTNINTFVEESIAKFIIGDYNPSSNADWNRFQNDLKTIGIERYLQIIQKTYDGSAFKR